MTLLQQQVDSGLCTCRKGGGPMTTDILAADRLAIASVQILSPQVRAGKLRLAVTGEALAPCPTS
jgi:hypothetical protein